MCMNGEEKGNKNYSMLTSSLWDLRINLVGLLKSKRLTFFFAKLGELRLKSKNGEYVLF